MDVLLLVLVFAVAYVVFMFLTFGLARLFFPPIEEKENAAKQRNEKVIRKGAMTRVNR